MSRLSNLLPPMRPIIRSQTPTHALLANTPSRTRTGTRTRTTTRPTTASTDAFIIAIIDNSVREVGFCSYNLNGIDIELRQFAEVNTYASLITALCVFDPVEILMCVSAAGGAVDRAISASPMLEFTKRSFVGRPYFNETYGAIMAEKLSSVPCPNLANLGESSCYLSLAACGALIRYVEHVQEISFAPASLIIRFRPNDHAVFIDWSALEGLEVVANARASAGVAGVGDTACLLKVMDKTKTRAGKRFLRRALLEPCADLSTIKTRQDAMDELQNSEETYFQVAAALSKFPDLEKSLASLLNAENARLRSLGYSRRKVHSQSQSRPQSSVDAESEASLPDQDAVEIPPIRRRLCISSPPSMRLIADILILKAALETVAPLLGSLQGFRSTMLMALAKSMRRPEFDLVRREINDVIDEEALPAKQSEKMRMQGAFAVKFGRNGSLDIYRKTLGENVDDMKTITEELKEKFHLPKLNLRMHTKRGYHLTIPAKALDVNDFPDDFIQIDAGKKVHRFSCDQLVQLNALYNDSLREIWRLQECELASLLNVIFNVEVLTALHGLCDSIAVLDTITSFVTYSTLCRGQTERPKLTVSGPIALKQAYHPTLLHLRPNETVPNDIFLDDTSALHVITGRNQAGKSTYIRMVGLVTIMAHTGCVVPAKFASVRLLHKLYTRFTRTSDLTKQQSDFSQEMSDVATILQGTRGSFDIANESETNDRHKNTNAIVTSPNTLVLIDELGRSTSTLDGFSIAYAVAEHLSFLPNVLTLFTTHSLGLGALATFNPVIDTFHLETVPVPSQEQEMQSRRKLIAPRRFTYTVISGTLEETSYGISTCAAAGFPESALIEAQELLKMLPVRTINSRAALIANHMQINADDKKRLRKTSSIVSLQQRISLIQNGTEDEDKARRLLLELKRKTKISMRRNRSASGSTSSTRVASEGENETKTNEYIDNPIQR